MATRQTREIIQHVRRGVLLRDGAGLTDGQLLEDYISRGEEATLAALVRRHGPMVWGVCRRVLRNHHDAEDAFQATFLVFVRKVASIAAPELLANWLYGVAHQTALKARATTAKRRARERQVTEMPEPAATEQDPWNDLQPRLDQELSRLPDKYRVAIVLCDLEGKTRGEAARQLGVPEGTLAARLARGRVLLAQRLGRHGLAVTGGVLAAMLSQNVASASVPASVVSSTIEAASLFAAGPAAAAGVVSAQVAALAGGVLKTMFLTKLKVATAVFLVIALLGVGAGVVARTQKALAAGRPEIRREATAQGQRPPAGAPKTPPGKDADKPKTDQERLQGTWEWVSWTQGGKTIKRGDLREEDSRPKALRFIGDKVLTVMVNTGGKEVEFKYRFKLDPSRKPKEIDLTPEGEPKGRTGPGVYELEEDTLRVCFPGQPGRERPTRLGSKEGEGYALLTFKRAAK
jgi:RNA polymerase sigma factor (sigma-70 family)